MDSKFLIVRFDNEGAVEIVCNLHPLNLSLQPLTHFD